MDVLRGVFEDLGVHMTSRYPAGLKMVTLMQDLNFLILGTLNGSLGSLSFLATHNGRIYAQPDLIVISLVV